MLQQDRNGTKNTETNCPKEIKQVVFGNVRQQEKVVVSTDNSQYHQHAQHFGMRNGADLAECRDNQIFEGLKEPISANHEEDG